MTIDNRLSTRRVIIFGLILLVILVVVVKCGLGHNKQAATDNVTPYIVYSDNTTEARYAGSIKSYNDSATEYNRQATLLIERQNEYVNAINDYNNKKNELSTNLAYYQKQYTDTFAQLQTVQAKLTASDKLLLDANAIVAKYYALITRLQAINNRTDMVVSTNYTMEIRADFYLMWDKVWASLW